MVFQYTDELIHYMEQKGKKNIIVEVAQSDSSDFEVAELHIHFVSDKEAALFVEKQGFHEFETAHGKVYLPNYRLSYADTVEFSLKKVLLWYVVKAKGIDF